MNSPILITSFARTEHLSNCLISLSACHEVRESEVFVVVDGYSHLATELVTKLDADYERLKATNFPFKNIIWKFREKNLGLALNITRSIEEILSQYQTIIVLEDDIRVHPGFLRYMNGALEHYRFDSRVMHINSFSWGFDDFFVRSNPPDLTAVPVSEMICWGWATWRDRWKYFDLQKLRISDPPRFLEAFRFNTLGTKNYVGQIRDNLSSSKLTWAVYWYWFIFISKGVCISPSSSLSFNAGFDGSGENCLKQDFSSSFDEFSNGKKFDSYKFQNYTGRIDISITLKIAFCNLRQSRNPLKVSIRYFIGVLIFLRTKFIPR